MYSGRHGEKLNPPGLASRSGALFKFFWESAMHFGRKNKPAICSSYMNFSIPGPSSGRS